MDERDRAELAEAVYLFGNAVRAPGCGPVDIDALVRTGLHESVCTAMLRILAVHDLLGFDGKSFTLSPANKEAQRRILECIDERTRVHCEGFSTKALDEAHFFFGSISELECEIYARCNFPVTYEMGQEAAKHIDISGQNVLELGGNSGGFGTALLERGKARRYTVVDMKIPCAVGNEYKERTGAAIAFEEGDVFALKPGRVRYDRVILMNLLHDFDDAKCLQILRGSIAQCAANAEFIVVEDVLTGNLEPVAAVLHGLRLAVECRGGGQRTIAEMARLFSEIGCKLAETIRLNEIHALLVFGRGDNER